MANITKEAFRAVMGSFAAGVTVVTTEHEGKKWGMTATAFSSLSLDPPLCLVCIDKKAGSHHALSGSKKFAVNFLAADQEELSNQFASRADDKYEGVEHSAGEATGCPILAGTLAHLECTVHAILPGGDHDIFVGELQATHVAEGKQPLVYYRGYADIAAR